VLHVTDGIVQLWRHFDLSHELLLLHELLVLVLHLSHIEGQGLPPILSLEQILLSGLGLVGEFC